jgi:hypothetical protein
MLWSVFDGEGIAWWQKDIGSSGFCVRWMLKGCQEEKDLVSRPLEDSLEPQRSQRGLPELQKINPLSSGSLKAQ